MSDTTSTKLTKLYGLQERKHTTIAVPGVPIAAQVKYNGGHIQMLYPGGYVSLDTQLYSMSKADRDALHDVITTATPTLLSASGSGERYHQLAVIPSGNGTGFQLALGDADGPVFTALAFTIDPTVTLAAPYEAAHDDGGDDDDPAGPDDDGDDD